MRILVTAAGRAIGHATCSALAAAGHEVIATAREVAMLDDLDVTLRLPLDVTDDESVRAAVAAAGPVDGLVNNAALGGSAPIETYPIDRVREMFETNVLGALRMVQHLTPGWRDRGRGVIVNISSVQGRVTSPLSGAYSASKHALEAISEAMHLELGHFGIRTVIIEPGFIAPGMKLPDDLPSPEIYRPLLDEWNGADTTLNANGRPGAEIVADAVVAAFADPQTPLRVPVGADAEMILATRAQMSDAEFEATMRAVLGLTW
jgi:NAD(P)-dependent dehydrogenase (short-subunit alcohol dehydrogenase family)